ncbi:VOC family protein [Embleya scabrispora]|uniref:VOC family protein n=1 Tax=Embleya scabrispora TaxID=159449 RepID=UPI0026B6B9FE|nr:VOC family protein [Embleya scabrispora]
MITTTDIHRGVAFWTNALGLRPRDPVTDDTEFVVLVEPDGGRHRISLQLGEVWERVEPPRVHLDLYTDDQEGEVERLLALGATRLPWDYPKDPDFVVLGDPDGHPFCVVVQKP